MPIEDIEIEYKSWLNLSERSAQAILAKAVIAMANYGGGFVILGFQESDSNRVLESIPKPNEYKDITQDRINSVIQKFATAAPDFHCKVYFISHQQTRVQHPIIKVPGDQKEPVMSKRDEEGYLVKHRCYIRKPGPKSEEPKTSEEWRKLLNRCVRANRDDLLDSIRTIVSGEVTSKQIEPGAQEDLKNFCDSAFLRWQDLIRDLPEEAPQRYLHGFYEMGFALQDATIIDSLNTLKQRLDVARRIRTTDWSPFLELPGLQPSYPRGQEIIEAWLGQPRSNMFMERIAFSTFWRVSRDGKLYTLTGYKEDDPLYRLTPGQNIEIKQPVWRVGEAAYFVERFCAEFPEVENVLIYLKFSGLEGRKLTFINNPIRMLDNKINHTPEPIELKDSVSVKELQNNMVEVIYKLLKPLYETFGFFQLDIRLVDEILSSLHRG